MSDDEDFMQESDEEQSVLVLEEIRGYADA